VDQPPVNLGLRPHPAARERWPSCPVTTDLGKTACRTKRKIPLLVDWGAEAERIEGVLPAARRAERRAGEVARQTERCVSGGLCGR